jgi:hypothetical protein
MPELSLKVQLLKVAIAFVCMLTAPPGCPFPTLLLHSCVKEHIIKDTYRSKIQSTKVILQLRICAPAPGPFIMRPFAKVIPVTVTGKPEF